MILNRVTAVGDAEPLTLADLRALVEKADEGWISEDAKVRDAESNFIYELYVEPEREEYR